MYRLFWTNRMMGFCSKHGLVFQDRKIRCWGAGIKDHGKQNIDMDIDNKNNTSNKDKEHQQRQ